MGGERTGEEMSGVGRGKKGKVCVWERGGKGKQGGKKVRPEIEEGGVERCESEERPRKTRMWPDWHHSPESSPEGMLIPRAVS